MLKLAAKFDSRAITGFNQTMRSQVPFATALALTNIAKLARDAVKADLHNHFILRNKFTENSIRFQRAEKRDWPKCSSQVGTVSPYLSTHEDGGEKTPGSKAFAIPKGIRTAENKLVRRAMWPGRILAGTDGKIPMGGRKRGSKNGARSKPVPFLMREAGGVGVYVRVSPKSRRLKRLYRLTREEIKIKPKHWLVPPVKKVLDAQMQPEFNKAMAKALETRR